MKSEMHKLVLTKEAMDLLFYACNNHLFQAALAEGFKRLKEEGQHQGSHLYIGPDPLWSQIIGGLINTTPITEGNQDD